MASRVRGSVSSFSNVAVGLPSKVKGSEAEDEWQQVDWITWSTGELTLDSESLLVFKPEAASAAVKAKPLGHLVKVHAVSHDEGRTFVVTTSDAINKLYRFTFDSARHASGFGDLAKAFEAKFAAEAKRAASVGVGRAAAEVESRLETEIRHKLVGKLPLVFGGVELYGPDPGAEGTSEVLLGRGALALVDPSDDEAGTRLGVYELLFYSEDDGVRSVAKRFQISQKMALRPQPCEDEDGPAASFELPGFPVHTITFDSMAVASAFARDYRVRQRLMEMAVKTVQGRNAASGLRGELEDLKQRSLAARLWRFFCFLVVLLLVGGVVRIAMLYAEDKTRTVPELFQDLLQDLFFLSRLSRGAAAKATAKACSVAVGSVPSEDVRLCAALPSAAQAKQCIEGLLGT